MAKGIFKRPNSQYWWIRYAGLDGRIIRESSGTTKIREAQALLVQRKQGIAEGKEPEIKRIANHTFQELCEQYYHWMQGRHRSAESKGYRVNQLLSHFGNIPLRRFSTLLVEQYQTKLMNEGLKPATVNKHISILKAMFTKATDWNLVEEETLKRVRRCKLLQENNKRLRYLSKEECQELIRSCDSHLKPIVITAINTGMRKQEVLQLTWDRVDLRHGFILLDMTKNGERREIPVNDTLRETLQGITRRLDTPYVFHDTSTGKPYKDVKRSFGTALRRAKIHDFRFHDLRHTFASHLVMAGIDITTVKELLGHKTLTMTLRYSHLAPAHKVKAVDILDNAINEKFTDTLTGTLGRK